MSASKTAKEIGAKSLKLCADICGKSRQTLNNIYKRDPVFFEVLVLGCLAKQKQLEERGD